MDTSLILPYKPQRADPRMTLLSTGASEHHLGRQFILSIYVHTT